MILLMFVAKKTKNLNSLQLKIKKGNCDQIPRKWSKNVVGMRADEPFAPLL